MTLNIPFPYEMFDVSRDLRKKLLSDPVLFKQHASYLKKGFLPVVQERGSLFIVTYNAFFTLTKKKDKAAKKIGVNSFNCSLRNFEKVYLDYLQYLEKNNL